MAVYLKLCFCDTKMFSVSFSLALNLHQIRLGRHQTLRIPISHIVKELPPSNGKHMGLCAFRGSLNKTHLIDMRFIRIFHLQKAVRVTFSQFNSAPCVVSSNARHRISKSGTWRAEICCFHMLIYHPPVSTAKHIWIRLQSKYERCALLIELKWCTYHRKVCLYHQIEDAIRVVMGEWVWFHESDMCYPQTLSSQLKHIYGWNCAQW